jgi:hypothetical protein
MKLNGLFHRVFVAKKDPSENAYCKFGVSPEGAVAVVRPDGHVSVVTTMSPSSAQGIIEFLVEL